MIEAAPLQGVESVKEADKEAPKKVNCIQMHISKPFVAYGLENGLVMCSIDNGARILEHLDQNFEVSRILFLESHNSIVTITPVKGESRTIMRVWKYNIINFESILNNQINVASKSELKFELVNVRYNQDILGLLSLHKIYFFSLKRFEIIHIVSVPDNKRGLLSMTMALSPGLAVIPDSAPGSFTILNLGNNQKSPSIKAHLSQITNLLITYTGARAATTSLKASTVRIFCCTSKELIQEIKLHNCHDQILSIRFSWRTDWMVVCTKDGKLRVFVTTLTPSENTGNIVQLENPKSAFRFLKSLISYFEYELPFAEFDSGQEVKGYLCTVKFEEDNNIVMAYTCTLSQVSKIIKLRFDQINGGACVKQRELLLE